MGFWSHVFGRHRTAVDALFHQHVVAAMAMQLKLQQHTPPPQMRHVSYEGQAAQFLDAALDGDAKAQYIVTGLITEFPPQLFAEPVNEVTMRQLMQRALHGDHVVQQQVAALLQQVVPLLQPLVRPDIPQTFKVLGNTSSNPFRRADVERTFPSWDEALAFAQTLARQSPDGDITIHPPRTGHALHYRVLSSGEVEEIDPKGQRDQILGGLS